MSDTRTFSRRAFVGAGAGAAAAALASRATASGLARDAFGGATILAPERIGIQLYTVRDRVSSIGFARVFETLAAIGYRQIEFAGYTQGTGPITTAQIRQLMDANGLVGIGSHVTPSDAAMPQILDDAEILGLPYVGIALVIPPNTTVSGWQQLADDFNRWGALAAARGVKFYFHNHFEEWTLTEQPPTRGIDVLLAETDPSLVFWEMDIYWSYVGQFQSGQQPFPFDPLEYAVRHRARIPFFHVKDGRRNQASPLGYDIVDVAEGHIDFETFFCTVGDRNRLWYLYENDNASSHPQGSLVSAKFSYVQMRHGLQGCGGPTAAVVRNFAATAQGANVVLTWRTASEVDLLGFHVWRRDGARLHRVNRALVRAQNQGRGRGGSYRLVDRGPGRGERHTYRLQLVHRSGGRTWGATAGT